MFGTLVAFGLVFIIGGFFLGILLGIIGYVLGEIAELMPQEKIKL